jgi:putative copper resistance protein D
MAFDLLVAQRAATAVLHASVASLAAAALAGWWLDGAASAWATVRRKRLGWWSAGGALLALLASIVLLWLQTAQMAEVPLLQAFDAIGLVLMDSHYGRAWSAGAGALAAAALWLAVARRRKLPGRAGLLVFVPLAVFWYAQCMSTHASEDGDASVLMLAYTVHLALISLWAGEVLVAGLAVFAGVGPMLDRERSERAAFVHRLSGSATAALAGILVTGAYLAWHMVPHLRDLFVDPYGQALLAKLVLVGLAAALGALNRFAVMPALVRGAAGAAATRFGRVLRAESAVLLAVIAVVAVLGSTAPPGTGS